MNELNIKLDDFMIERFSLEELKRITDYDNREVLSNIISDRYEKNSDLTIIGYEIIKGDIYFFLRWQE